MYTSFRAAYLYVLYIRIDISLELTKQLDSYTQPTFHNINMPSPRIKEMFNNVTTHSSQNTVVNIPCIRELLFSLIPQYEVVRNH